MPRAAAVGRTAPFFGQTKQGGSGVRLNLQVIPSLGISFDNLKQGLDPFVHIAATKVAELPEVDDGGQANKAVGAYFESQLLRCMPADLRQGLGDSPSRPLLAAHFPSASGTMIDITAVLRTGIPIGLVHVDIIYSSLLSCTCLCC